MPLIDSFTRLLCLEKTAASFHSKVKPYLLKYSGKQHHVSALIAYLHYFCAQQGNVKYLPGFYRGKFSRIRHGY